MQKERPNIFAYNDFRKFISDLQQYLVLDDDSYTKSYICRMLGLPNSRSYFNDVLGGKKVTKQYINRFAEVFKLNEDESRFFHVLVKFNQAEDVDERELYFDQLISLNQTPKTILERDVYKYYRYWYNSVIRALLNIIDFRDDYKSLAKKVYPAITSEEAKESIKLMNSLNLIEKNNKGLWKPTGRSITSPSYARDDMIKQYQITCFEMGKNAIINNTKMKQDVSTNVISISENGFARLQKHIEKFRSEVRSLVHKDESPADRVYQMDILLFPNSEQNLIKGNEYPGEQNVKKEDS